MDDRCTPIQRALTSESPEELRRLLDEVDAPEVRRALVTNAHLPQELLWRLIEEHPVEVATCPDLSTETLRSLLWSLRPESWRLLLGSPECPQRVIELALEERLEYSREALVAAPSRPVEERRRALLRLSRWTFRRPAGEVLGEETPPRELADLWGLCRRAERGDELDEREWAQLFADGTVGFELASDQVERLPASAFETFCERGEAFAQEDALRRESGAGPLARRLARAEDWSIRARVAALAELPADLLATLAADPHPTVRWAVAARGALPPELAEQLAGDGDPLVRGAVAARAELPVEVWRRLAGDADEQVRVALARNAATPEEVLLALAEDVKGVTRALSERPALSPELIDALCQGAAVSERLLEGRSLAPEQLRALAGAEDGMARAAVARAPETPADVLERLAADRDLWPRGGVARNPAAPPSLLLALAADEAEGVRKGVAKNPAAPAEALRLLAADRQVAVRKVLAMNKELPEEAQLRLARDKALSVLRNLAANPGATPAALALLAEDRRAAVRALAASHARLPVEALAKLRGDSANAVRDVAARNRRALLNASPAEWGHPLVADLAREAAAAHTARALDGLRVLWLRPDAGDRCQLLASLPDGAFLLLVKLKRRWRFFEGDRDAVLATVPDELFDEVTAAAAPHLG